MSYEKCPKPADACYDNVACLAVSHGIEEPAGTTVQSEKAGTNPSDVVQWTNQCAI